MRGSLSEWGGPGSGKWKLRVYTGRDGRNRPTYLSRNFSGTRRQAQSALSKLVADVERRQATAHHGGSVRDLLTRWLADIESTRSPGTMREHRRSVERNILPAIGSVRLDRLTTRHLDELYLSLLARGLSPASVRRHHAILCAALRRAVKWDWLASNTAERASPHGTSLSMTRSAPSSPNDRQSNGPTQRRSVWDSTRIRTSSAARPTQPCLACQMGSRTLTLDSPPRPAWEDTSTSCVTMPPRLPSPAGPTCAPWPDVWATQTLPRPSASTPTPSKPKIVS